MEEKDILYVPIKCHACEGENIQAVSEFNGDGIERWQEIECQDCNATWKDVYRFIGKEQVEGETK